MLTNFGRRVEVSIRTYAKGPDQEKIGPTDTLMPAVFHQWGTNNMNKRGQPPVMQTVGIVELENGKCARVLPDFITFLEPMKEITAQPGESRK